MFDDHAAEQPGGLALVDAPSGGPVSTLRGWELDGREPGADLAWLLETGSLAEADDTTVLEAVAAWERMASWAAAGAARAAAVLAERSSMNPDWPREAQVADPDVAGDELAMRLVCSRFRGRQLVREGRAFLGALAATGSALARGHIDTARARALVDALDRPGVGVELALEVQAAVLGAAPGRTAGQLRRDVAGALIRLDPEGADARHRAARRTRRVERPRTLPDGMAGLYAVLPAVEARQLDAGIDQIAHAARNGGDPRTLDQLRADVLVDLTLGRLTVEGGCGAPPAQGGGEETTVGGAVDAGAPASAPAGPGAAVLVAAAGAAGPGAAPPGAAPGRARHAEAVPAGVPEPRLPDTPAATLRRSAPVPPRAQIHVHVPLATLLGATDEPGVLAGYGAITADEARRLAFDAGSTWRRLVTDPASGAVLDVGRTRYRPPEPLAEHVRARDGWCSAPGCSAPAESCDLDHTVDFGRSDGTTAHHNLGPLCARHHQLKTAGQFRLHQPRPGVFDWHTPAGQRYRVVPGTEGPVVRSRVRGGPEPDAPSDPPY